MPFVKLDCGILNSTLWVDRSRREVFITALLMAQPVELREPTPALHPDRIEPTGFVVPAGWYGFVAAAGPGIIRMAMCDQAEGLAALAELGSPDPESRTPGHEGRRMVRVDGGYIVLNYMKYREKDNTAAIRAKRYREQKKQASEAHPKPPDEASQRHAVASRRHAVTSRDGVTIVTKAEAEAEEEIRDRPSTKVSARPKPEQPAQLALVKAEPAEQTGPYVPPTCPHEKILALWAECMPEMPQHIPSQWKGTRADHLRARWRETAVDKHWPDADAGLRYFRKLFAFVRKSPFLSGKVTPTPGRRQFQLELAWLVNPTNWAATLEGKYHDGRAA